jgi:hypothetical protein
MSTSLKLKSAYRYNNCVPLSSPKVQSLHCTLRSLNSNNVTTFQCAVSIALHTLSSLRFAFFFFWKTPLHPFVNFRVSTARFTMLTHKHSSFFLLCSFFFLCIEIIFSQILPGLQLENSSFTLRIEREKRRARSATSRCFASSSRTCLSPLEPQVLLGRY